MYFFTVEFVSHIYHSPLCQPLDSTATKAKVDCKQEIILITNWRNLQVSDDAARAQRKIILSYLSSMCNFDSRWLMTFKWNTCDSWKSTYWFKHYWL